MGSCTPSSSCIRAELTIVCDTAKYKNRSFPIFERLKRGGVIKYCFRLSKAIVHSFVHSNFFLRSLKNGKHLFVDRETNLLRVAICPLKHWTSFTFVGGDISIIALILFGFALIPLYDTIKPRNFPDSTTKMHLDRFGFMLYFRRVSKVSSRSVKWSIVYWLLTSMSPTYASIFHPTWLWNMRLTNLWYVALHFLVWRAIPRSSKGLDW